MRGAMELKESFQNLVQGLIEVLLVGPLVMVQVRANEPNSEAPAQLRPPSLELEAPMGRVGTGTGTIIQDLRSLGSIEKSS